MSIKVIKAEPKRPRAIRARQKIHRVLWSSKTKLWYVVCRGAPPAPPYREVDPKTPLTCTKCVFLLEQGS